MGRYKDLTNQRFGRLVAIRRITEKSKPTKWKCKCDCGKFKEIRSSDLITNKTTSCGCFKKEQLSKRNYKHGYRGSSLYRRWLHMRQRCSNPLDKSYRHYGGRGITVCEEWEDFESFKDWSLKNGYQKNLTIERIDNNGNYGPENCKWIQLKKQALNRRSNTIITHNGKSLHAIEWSKLLGIPAPTISYRLSKGYPPELILKQGRI